MMELEPTGERVIEEHYQSSEQAYLIYLFHVATYNFCKRYISAKKVLDYGCGSGYGTASVSDDCASIVGIDISADAIAYAKSHYQAANLSYQVIANADDAPLPFPDAFFDVVLSFQVIEHIEDVRAYLQEIKRVLTPGGVAIIATPDRSGRLLPFQKPWNMWHVKEYSRTTLYKTLATQFTAVDVQKMGGEEAVIRIELDRTRKLMWTTLPVTLPIVPEIIRINCLRFLKFLNRKLSPSTTTPFIPSFNESSLSISANEKNSVNLIALAKNA